MSGRPPRDAARRVRALLTRRMLPEDLAYVRARLDPAVEVIEPREFTEEAIVEAAAAADALLGPSVTRRLLETHGARIAFIQVPWTGLDLLDMALLREFRPVLCNSHSNAPYVAEHAVALLLAAARAIPLHDRDLRQGVWRRPGAGSGEAAGDGFLPPATLRGATVALLGYGAIGREVAVRLAAFGARLCAVRSRAAGPAPAPLAEVTGLEGWPELAARVDFAVLSLPLTPATKHVVNRDVLARMKRQAILVNVGRGELIEEEALYETLRDRRIAGAALDAWFAYPKAGEERALPSARFPFHELDNLVLSPHRAGYARGLHPHLDDAIENLNRFARGDELLNRVDLERGY